MLSQQVSRVRIVCRRAFKQRFVVMALTMTGTVLGTSCSDETGTKTRRSSDQSVGIPVVQLDTFRGPECGTEPVMSAEPICGGETFKVAPHASCGAIMEEREDERCDAEEYFAGPHESCGVARYNERVDPACGQLEQQRWLNGGVVGAICPSGWDFVLRESTGHRSTKTLCRRFVTNSCGRPEFGVASYNSCPHPSFGAKRYRRCSVTVGFQSCQHPDNGIETFKICAVKTVAKSCRRSFDAVELATWTNKLSEELPARVEEGLLAATRFYEVTRAESGLACLKARLSRADFFVAYDGARFARVYEKIQAAAYAIGSTSLIDPDRVSVEDVCDDSANVGDSNVCAAESFNEEACKSQSLALALTDGLADDLANLKSVSEQRPAGQTALKSFDTAADLKDRLRRILARPRL